MRGRLPKSVWRWQKRWERPKRLWKKWKRLWEGRMVKKARMRRWERCRETRGLAIWWRWPKKWVCRRRLSRRWRPLWENQRVETRIWVPWWRRWWERRPRNIPKKRWTRHWLLWKWNGRWKTWIIISGHYRKVRIVSCSRWWTPWMAVTRLLLPGGILSWTRILCRRDGIFLL